MTNYKKVYTIVLIMYLVFSLSINSVFSESLSTGDELYLQKISFLKDTIAKSTNKKLIDRYKIELNSTINKLKDENLRDEEMEKIKESPIKKTKETELDGEMGTGFGILIFLILIVMVFYFINLALKNEENDGEIIDEK